jgi:predicted ATPase
VARASSERFPHGTWFIDLAGLRDPGLLETVVASTLGVRESSERTAAEALRAYLRDRTALLLLDNLEQLLPAGADVVSALVRDAPRIRVLVTSRELLRIGGELGYPVPPLDLEAGIALFVERARAHRPDLVLGTDSMTAVRAICERLGGLPLAIELAAARTRMLSPEGILDRLGHSLDLAGGARDVPERQRTLRAAIAWSHDLLSEPEQRLFRRLSVFVGGWSLDAAQLVTDPAGDLGMDLYDGLESLADKSLIQVEPAVAGEAPQGPPADEIRYGVHPLLREFGLERLAASGEAAEVEARHAAVTAEVAERAGRSILGPAGEASLRALDREESNIRAAVGWSLASSQPAVGLRIVGATWRWFQQRGRLREGRALLAELLPLDHGEDVAVRIAGLTADGGLAYWMDDFSGARQAYEERLELARGTGDPGTIADADYDLGFLSMVAQDGPQLLEHEQRALELYQKAGRTDGVIRARQGLVLAHYLSGDFALARDLELQNNDGFRQAGSAIEVADSAVLLAAIFLRLGDPVTAWQHAIEGLRLFAGNDLASGLARSLGMAAIIQLQDGDPEFGARLAGSTMELVREKGVMLAPVKVLHLPDPAELAGQTLGPERAAEQMAVGASTARSEMVAAVLATSPPTS